MRLSIMMLWFAAAAHAQTISYFPRVVSTDPVITGIALSNPSSKTASVILTMYDEAGTAFQPRTVQLSAGEQYTRLTTEVFPESAGKRGYIEVSADVPDILGLYLSGDFSNAVDGAELLQASTGLTFPLITQLGSTTTELTLTNPTGKAEVAEMSLYDADGMLLSRVSRIVQAHEQWIGRIDSVFGAGAVVNGYVRARSDGWIFGAAALHDQGKDLAILHAEVETSFDTLVFPACGIRRWLFDERRYPKCVIDTAKCLVRVL
jgi:hypothetical protein